MDQPLPQAPPPKLPIWVAVLAGCGLIGVLACGGIIAFFGWGFWDMKDALPEAKLFLKEALPKISQPWNVEEARKYSMPQAFEGQEEEWRKVFKMYETKLGNLKDIDVDEPMAYRVRSFNADLFAELRYDAVFEKGRGEVICILHRAEKGWQFQQFFIRSKAFMPD